MTKSSFSLKLLFNQLSLKLNPFHWIWRVFTAHSHRHLMTSQLTGWRHLQVSLGAYMLYAMGDSPLSQIRGFNGVHHRLAKMLPAMSGWNPIKSIPFFTRHEKGEERTQPGANHQHLLCIAMGEEARLQGDFSFGTYCLLNSAINTISMFVITRKFSIKCKEPETSKSILSFDCFID